MSVESHGPGPYSKRTMRLLAISGSVLTVLILGWGIRDAVAGHPNAPMRVGIGIALAAVFLIGIPVAKRRGRM